MQGRAQASMLVLHKAGSSQSHQIISPIIRQIITFMTLGHVCMHFVKHPFHELPFHAGQCWGATFNPREHMTSRALEIMQVANFPSFLVPICFCRTVSSPMCCSARSIGCEESPNDTSVVNSSLATSWDTSEIRLSKDWLSKERLRSWVRRNRAP